MKIKELQKEIRKQKISYCVLLREDDNIHYLTGYKDAFCLIVPAKRPAYVLSPEIDYERCKKESSVRTIKWKKGNRLFEEIKKREKGKTIGINFDKITINEQKAMRKILKCRSKDISKELTILRRTKTKKEIEIYKKGCMITSRIIKEMLKRFKKFKTELDVADFLRSQTEKYDGMSFGSIVASGKKSSMPHSTPEKTRIKKGFCVIDFGIIYKGYCTDITRTIYIGKPSKKEIDEYNKVLKVQEECIKMVEKGAKVKDLYEHAYSILGKPFNHGLGHGIGVYVHEFPNISSGSNERIEKGMIFTIEPGVYYPDKFGIRIEDDVLFDGKKAVVLTKVPKKLITF